ncbi:hypothetical protein QE152_g5865 [Popillia japonica]|uniref:Uncharacterized protein n=1 Tax=Popillia japonica TaxID=7064 RepID=A0AAW1ML36_POPJA
MGRHRNQEVRQELLVEWIKKVIERNKLKARVQYRRSRGRLRKTWIGKNRKEAKQIWEARVQYRRSRGRLRKTWIGKNRKEATEDSDRCKNVIKR